MNDKQIAALIVSAQTDLRKVKKAFDPSAPNWRRAMSKLERAHAALAPPPEAVPNLGPILRGGLSVLAHDLTHDTSGLALFPAFDEMGSPGTPVIAPEDMVIDTKLSHSNPGLAIYATGKSGLRYWFGHLDRQQPLGKKFKKGEVFAEIGENHIGGGPHCHCGVNAEAILGKGKELLHKHGYQHGAPTVGVQLRAALA